jgi:sugar (pentulose or hexulose) kinase
MTGSFRRVFGAGKPVIAMVHLGALPGTPLHDADGGVATLIEGARRDLAALQAAGFEPSCSAMRAEPRAIFAVGGGTKNRVWAQATSDVSGRTQLLRSKTVGACYGDAFLAALRSATPSARTSRAGTRCNRDSWRIPPTPRSIVANTRSSATSTGRRAS